MISEDESNSEDVSEDTAPALTDESRVDGDSEDSQRGRYQWAERLRAIAPFFVLVYVAVSGFVWAVATPLGGVPDEPAHVVYATAVVRHDYGRPLPVDHPEYSSLMSHVVPEWVTSIVVCYAFDRTVTADCQPPIDEGDEPVSKFTTVARYQPPYYWVVGLPTLALTGSGAFYAMRAASVILATVLVGLGLGVAAPGRRWWLSVGVLAAFTPMAAFLIGSVNPNGAEIAGAIGLAVAILGLVGGPVSRSRLWFQVVSVVVLAVYLAWARPGTWLTLVAVGGATLLLNRRGVAGWLRVRPAVITAAAALVGFAVIAVLLFEAIARAPVMEVLEYTGFLATPAPLVNNLDSVLGNWAALLMQDVGIFGWLDHSLPQSLQLMWLILVGVLLVSALAVGKREEQFLLIAAVIGSTILAPLFVIHFVFGSFTGYQGRYQLPLVILIPLCAVFVLGLRTEGAAKAVFRPIFGWIGFLFPLTMLFAVMWSISRYSIGEPLVWSNILSLSFLLDAVWEPPMSATVVLILGSVVLVVLAPIMRKLGATAPTIAFEDRIDEG